jgi:hypothetical protein
MKTISSNLIKFAFAACFPTIVFRFSLKNGIDTDSSILITTSALAYGLAMFMAG